MSTTLLTFGAGSKKYYDALCRLKKQAKDFPFDNIVTYTDLDLENSFPDFWKQHSSFIKSNRRGYGYWLWKPFIIYNTLKNLKDGDVLVYMDCGCELNNKGLARFKNYIETVKSQGYLFFNLEDQHIEWRWNKMDLIKHLQIQDDKSMYKPQRLATVQFYLKNDINVSFTKEYYNICCNYSLLDDSNSVLKNHPFFNENRHDQSVFSLLSKKNNYESIYDETWPDTMTNKDKSMYPIWALRNYSFDSKIKF
jgi:hypothetical protein